MSATKIPLAGVIGHPVGHSLSPALHAHWLSELGLEGYYIPMDIEPGDLQATLATLPRMGFVGANVTLPHKTEVMRLVTRMTDRARRIGAVNTLVFASGNRVIGDCTDGEGFLRNMKQGAPDWDAASGPAVVYGAGGAARAIVDALATAGAPEIRLVNRTEARAESLLDLTGTAGRVVDWDLGPDLAADAVTAVNTTSLGMTGQPPLSPDFSRLAPGAVVTDAVYTPLDTAFLQAGRAAGAKTVDGLGMLLHQAVPGFARWFGAEPVVTEATRAAVLRS